MESADQLFFHGKISRVEAEQILVQYAIEGAYLVRTSTSSPGDYVLSMLCQRKPQHFQIKNQGEVRRHWLNRGVMSCALLFLLLLHHHILLSDIKVYIHCTVLVCNR